MFEDVDSKDLVQKGCTFAGHSLGEQFVLAFVASNPTIAAIVYIFYRGVTMKRAIERDGQNRPNYVMCAVNPSRIIKTFNGTALWEVVDTVS